MPSDPIAGEDRRHTQDLAERVKQYLGLESPRVEPGVGLDVEPVGIVGLTAESVGTAIDNTTDQVPQVVATADEVAGQPLEQLGIRRRVAAAASSIGWIRPRPRKWPHMRLTIVRAK